MRALLIHRKVRRRHTNRAFRLFDKFKAQSKIALRLFLKAGETNGDLGSFRGAVLRMLCARQVTPAWKV